MSAVRLAMIVSNGAPTGRRSFSLNPVNMINFVSTGAPCL